MSYCTLLNRRPLISVLFFAFLPPSQLCPKPLQHPFYFYQHPLSLSLIYIAQSHKDLLSGSFLGHDRGTIWRSNGVLDLLLVKPTTEQLLGTVFILIGLFKVVKFGDMFQLALFTLLLSTGGCRRVYDSLDTESKFWKLFC